jgi:CRP-like cAMP-binding protein
MIDKILDADLFKGISKELLNDLFSQIHYRIKKYSKNDIIAFGGDEYTSLMILISGTVKAEMEDFSGKAIKIEDVSAPNTLAEAFIFGKKNILPVTVTAKTDTEVLYMDKSDLLKLLQLNEIILKNYLNCVSTRFQMISMRIKFLAFKTIKGKLAHYLINLSKGKDVVKLDKTQQDLADFFGVTRPSLARAISEMQHDNIISVNKKEVTIVDIDKLKQLLQ